MGEPVSSPGEGAVLPLCADRRQERGATADTFFRARSEATRSNARSAEQKPFKNRVSSIQAGDLNKDTAERFSPIHLLGGCGFRASESRIPRAEHTASVTRRGRHDLEAAFCLAATAAGPGARVMPPRDRCAIGPWTAVEGREAGGGRPTSRRRAALGG